MDYVSRIKRVQKLMLEKGVDYLILTPSTDLLYLTGFRGRLDERLTCLILTQKEPFFVFPKFEAASLHTKISIDVNRITWDESDDPFDIIVKHFADDRRMVAVGTHMPGRYLCRFQARFSNWKYILSEELLNDMRMHKDVEEEAIILEGHNRCNKALLRLYEHGLCGMTELAAKTLLMSYCLDEGLSVQRGTNMVATGPNGALQHYQSSDSAVITKGDPVIIDFGYEYQGYISDITRTPVIKTVSSEVKEIYEIVRRANETAFASVKLGETCESIDYAGRKVIEDAGFGEYFTHRLGHGIGLDLHEDPYIVRGNKRLLEDGYTFSDEPGIYLNGKFGIRIEDILIARPDGAHKLNNIPHDMVIID